MARRSKAGSGNGDGGEGATVTLLEAIREQLVGMRGEITAMRHEMSDGFRLVSDRIDNVLVGPLASYGSEVAADVSSGPRGQGAKSRFPG
ncbi:MAG: hypothetical protein HYY06_02765 [Deltaproteobacteria bacterium]|nr:hypothetical protein [Deltaproteobacteria bacterium]